MTEFRFCIGSPQGLRSTVWKIWSGTIGKSDVYIQSRMMGSDMKISLHESGLCQCSMTNEWVEKYNKSNAERHITRWQRQEPISTIASLIFQIIIPESELRQTNVREKLQKVKWVEAPQLGYATKIECYITPPLALESLEGINFPHPCLVYFQLPSKNWFVSLVNQEVMTDENLHMLDYAHKEIERHAHIAGVELKPEFRAGFGTYESTKDIHGIVEVVPVPRTG